MAVERALALTTRPDRGTDGAFPEFYFLDCHSCHRRIGDESSFRPSAVTNPGRPIPSGMPPFNDENMIMLSAAARVTAPALAARFDADARLPSEPLPPAGQQAVQAAQAPAAIRRQSSPPPSTGESLGAPQAFAMVDAVAASAQRFTDYEAARRPLWRWTRCSPRSLLRRGA